MRKPDYQGRLGESEVQQRILGYLPEDEPQDEIDVMIAVAEVSMYDPKSFENEGVFYKN